MEPEAISKACTMLAAGEVEDFVIDDDDGTIVTTYQQIRRQCKKIKMP